ncbi:MAG: flavodoxin family protein [Desulfobacteraceae bacterium]|jgi:flavodoxin
MKALVTYYSETGNTKKVAENIYEALEEVKKDLTPIDETVNPGEYDVIFCGFPVHAHSVPPKAASFIKGLPEGSRIALFATHGSLRGGELAVTAFHHALTLASKLKVLGTFGCRGKVKPSIIEGMMKKPEHKAWAEEAQSATGHPDRHDMEDAAQFAALMIQKARRLQAASA